MSGEKPYGGTLVDWFSEQVSQSQFRINGNLHGDPQQRFGEGTFVHTSCVVGLQQCENGMAVLTMNTRYLLGRPLSRSEGAQS